MSSLTVDFFEKNHEQTKQRLYKEAIHINMV